MSTGLIAGAGAAFGAAWQLRHEDCWHQGKRESENSHLPLLLKRDSLADGHRHKFLARPRALRAVANFSGVPVIIGRKVP
jgi:hypothetical protein